MLKNAIVTKSGQLIAKGLVCLLIFLCMSCKNNSNIPNQEFEKSSIPIIKNSNNFRISEQACLENLDLKWLQRSLDQCNLVISQHQNNPLPLNDRSLIYILMGENILACADVSKALKLIDKQSKEADPLILHELKVRQGSCKQHLNIKGKD